MTNNFFIITLIFVILNISLIIFYSKLANFLDILDKPNIRKIHKGNIPPIGGLAIYTSILIFYSLLGLDNSLNLIFFCSLILLFVGLIDDKYEIGVTVRLFCQLFVCLIVVGAGMQIENIGDYGFFKIDNLGIYGLLITIICVVGLTNAINFMDGIDGLSSGLILSTIISILSFLYFEGNVQNLNFFLFLSLGILIFIFFNFQKVKFKIFLGDSGSNSLGFLIAWLLIYFSQPDINGFHPVLVVWCVIIPVFDFACITSNRIINKKNPFFPDRKHIHHLLIENGFSNLTISIFLIFLSFFLSIIGYGIYSFLGSFYCLVIYFILFIFYIIINSQLRNI